jgi:hypothetical protein
VAFLWKKLKYFSKFKALITKHLFPMKKHLLILSLTLLLCKGSSAAQDVPFFDLGLKLGANGTSFSQLPEDGYDFSKESMKIGITGGLWARINVPATGLHIQPELVYAQYAAAFKDKTSDGRATQKIQAIDFGLLVGYRVGLGPLGARLQVGPVLTTPLSRELEIEDPNFPTFSIDIEKQSLWSLQFGLGADISRLSLDLRYQLGLTEQQFTPTDSQATFSPDKPYKQSSIVFTLGIKLL